MRIFSLAEYCFRVPRRMSRTSHSDGAAVGPDFCWWRRYASYWIAASARLDKDSIKPPPTIDPIQQLLDEIDERSRS
jgi:hypothetical protein